MRDLFSQPPFPPTFFPLSPPQKEVGLVIQKLVCGAKFLTLYSVPRGMAVAEVIVLSSVAPWQLGKGAESGKDEMRESSDEASQTHCFVKNFIVQNNKNI